MIEFFKNLFKPDIPEVEPTNHVMTPAPQPKVIPERSGNTQWRSGMWVIVNGSVGILHRFIENQPEVHYVNVDTGETILVKTEPMLALRQCTYDEIPLVRREGFTLQAAERLGYGS